MSFRPDALRGAPSTPPAGEISYRLARNAVIDQFRKGRLSRLDVCDAHPELLRAARGVGDRTTEVCPICEETDLVHVSYAFGPGLPARGRLISSPADLARTARGHDAACYVVEVCPECSWNHLARTFVIAHRR